MPRQFSIAQIILWLLVVVTGVAVGGGLYEQLVVMPLWTSAPPDSVIEYYRHNVANPQFTLNQGGRFWIFVMPLLGLLSIATLLSGLRTRPEHRRWRIAASALILLVTIITFAWFIPNIIKLTGEAVLTMPREDVAALANRWATLNWLRAALFIAGWLAALRALTIAPKEARGIY
jgi:hypothetical protein